MELTKIIGWITFFLGILIVVFALYSSYNIFTGKTTAPEIFKIEEEAPTAPTGKAPTSPTELQEEMERMVGEQLKGILPVDALPKILNLAIWAMLAGILIFGGSQISGLGAKLLKN